MTELTWQGKYQDSKKVAPVRLSLPFQTIETVNETRPVAGTPDMFGQASQQAARASGWYNRLIWGDKKYVLPSLLPEFAGQVNLIYIDPPFDTGANFSFTATVPADQVSETNGSEASQFVKQPSMLEQKAYRDTWGRGWTATYSGSTKPPCCCANYWPTMAASTCIWIGTSATTRSAYWMKCLGMRTLGMRLCGITLEERNLVKLNFNLSMI